MSNKFAIAQKNREVSSHTQLQATKHPGGRPKKSDDQKQSEKVFLTFTKVEKEQLQISADNNALAISQFIRKVLKENGYL